MKEKEMLDLMGKVVTATHRLVSYCESLENGWNAQRVCEIVPLNTPVSGWVVGFRWLKEGTVRRYTEGQSEFKVTGTIPVVVVSPWPTKKHIFVPLNSFGLGGEPVPPKKHPWRE